MARKFVRGITDINQINQQDFDTNNVNDLLSDGEYNYIHRKKKDKSEEYHNLTDNIKTISSDNTDLLSVTNYNKSNNTATLHPKHDVQKEQVLESTRNTITLEHAENGTSETTKVDTNPEKVLEHENLLTDYGISKNTTGNTTKLGIEYTKVTDGFDLNNLISGFVRGLNLTNAPTTGWFFVETFGEGSYTVQKATALSTPNTKYVRLKSEGVWGAWREQVGDKDKSHVVVAKDGSGDFNTIQDAIDSFVKGSNVHIVLREGVYDEVINVTTKFNNFILEGVSRDLCVVQSTTGQYKDSTLLVSGNFTIRNLTVRIQNDANWIPTYDMDDLPNTFPGYALHIDQPSLDETKLNYGLVENCVLFSYNAFPAVGMGTWKNQQVEFRNCKINRWVDNDIYKKDGWRGSFLCHSSNYNDHPNQHLILVNNTFECNYGKSAHIRGGLGEPSYFNLYAVNNMFYSYELGHDSVEYEKSKSILHPASYGNTATNLNNTI